MTYMDDFLKSKEVRKDPNSKYALESDKWDRKKAADIEKELKEYRLASKDLQQFTETGHEALRDALLALFKIVPQLRDPKEVRPSFLINHRVEQEMMELREYQNLHSVTRGDAVAAGLATVDLEPELEILFDKLKSEQQMASQLEQSLQEAEGMSDDIDELLEAASQAADSGDEEEAKNYQDQAAKIQEALEKLKEALEKGSAELEQSLDAAQPEITESLKRAISEVAENAEVLSSFDSWSLEPGSLKRMSTEARIALSKRLQTDKFKKMAQIFGRVQTMAMTEQHNKVDYAQEEIFDITTGNHLSRMLPHEVLYMSDPVFKWDWMRRFIEGNLLQYDLRGTETTQQGGIICAEDGSGSMRGEREIWSKAISLALLKIAHHQNRSFTCIHFGGVGQYILFEFDTSGTQLQLKMTCGNQVSYYSGAEAVVEFADKGLNSGTDFMTPMNVALDCMELEYETDGLVGSDLIFLTDGQCGVDPGFLKRFKERQVELGFNVYGIAICTNPKSEPLLTIADGKVTSIKEVADLSNMKPIFGGV